jgi:predicted dehydrogenase
MFTGALVNKFQDTCQLVGLCDRNQTRMEYCIRRHELGQVPAYKAEDFDRMIEEQKPEWVIVTTMDCFHDKYICRAMELGCNVVTEKPMTTDGEKCQRILDTQKKTGQRIIVTFNYRYAPIRSVAKKMVQEGAIGQVRSVDFNWMLDQRHGADYYRRWHRQKKNSGGLLVHKATHHFDLVNWWIDDRPERVYAEGRRVYATPEMARRMGLENHAERCLECPVSGKCKYFLDLEKSENWNNLYRKAEHEDGYFRDRCVFSEEIDIEDQMTVSVKYRSGVTMDYSLNTFLPYEGYRLTINGTEGRLEMFVGESSYVSGDGSTPGELLESSYLRIYPLFGEPYEPEIPEAKGGHGGGDDPLLENVFSKNPPPDPLGRAASETDGAYSILVGIAGNQSIATGQPVNIEDLVKFPS